MHAFDFQVRLWVEGQEWIGRIEKCRGRKVQMAKSKRKSLILSSPHSATNLCAFRQVTSPF